MSNSTKSTSAAEAEKLVLDFLHSWDGRDLDHIMSFFTPDAIYHNVPVAPIVGAAGIRNIFAAFLDAFAVAALDVVSIAAKPDLVLAERIDRFTLRGGGKVVLPVNGVFVLRGGKIARFSDYFDLASFEQQSGMNL